MGIHPDLTLHPGEPLRQPIVGFAKTQSKNTANNRHSHQCAQLFHVVAGSAAVETEFGTYFVPPERALWIPPGIEHQGRYLQETEIRFLYFEPGSVAALPDRPQVLQVTHLLRELILEFMSYARVETVAGPAARIGGVILDQLRMLPAAPLQLPMPKDKKLRDVCERIVRCPAHVPALKDAALQCAISTRSFERRMKDETGLNYRTWCRQVKLFRALELLACGRSVSDVSYKLGYEEPSAFVSTFRKAFGVTPGRYFASPSPD
ncbi:AraC family transcriptional regulator [Roseibium hamelinense]|uniref:AraC family transcriptional regulator n=1 Tax=Roseibium hamelinense TaxID=150831 RepID=UPI00119F4777|nr:helix-turn-helix transcriptional regulator [Roseibium hamelinense]MTI45279.1 AraC family transcriptional regulator [Roseibium hamelinense]